MSYKISAHLKYNSYVVPEKNHAGTIDLELDDSINIHDLYDTAYQIISERVENLGSYVLTMHLQINNTSKQLYAPYKIATAFTNGNAHLKFIKEYISDNNISDLLIHIHNKLDPTYSFQFEQASSMLNFLFSKVNKKYAIENLLGIFKANSQFGIRTLDFVHIPLQGYLLDYIFSNLSNLSIEDKIELCMIKSKYTVDYINEKNIRELNTVLESVKISQYLLDDKVAIKKSVLENLTLTNITINLDLS